MNVLWKNEKNMCGDDGTENEEGISPMAPRIGIAVNMQASTVLEWLLKKENSHK